MTAWKSSRRSLKRAHRLGEIGRCRRDLALEQAVDVGAPLVERGAARLARAGRVGDVVDRAAEGVDRIHRLAARTRQDAHAEIEGAAGGRKRRRVRPPCRRRVVRRDRHQRPRVPAGSPTKRAPSRTAGGASTPAAAPSAISAKPALP